MVSTAGSAVVVDDMNGMCLSSYSSGVCGNLPDDEY